MISPSPVPAPAVGSGHELEIIGAVIAILLILGLMRLVAGGGGRSGRGSPTEWR